MSVYTVAIRTSATTATANAVLAAFRSDTTQRTKIREIKLFNFTAPTTSGGIGICRSLTQGTATSPVVATPLDTGDAASAGQLEATWSVTPTVAATPLYLERWAHSTTIGNGMVWTWDVIAPLILPASAAINASICFCNLQATAPSLYDITIKYEV